MYSGPIADVHTHFYSKNYVKNLERRTKYPFFKIAPDGRGFIHFSETLRSAPITELFLNPDQNLHEMDNYGITTQVLSPTNPWTDFFPTAELALEYSRIVNDELGSIVRRHRNDGRFLGLATLPLLAPLDAAAELERAVDELGLIGAIIGTNVRGTYLSDQTFSPVFDVANKKKCILFIHPSTSFGGDKLADHGLSRSLGYVFDTTVCLVKLAYSGIFDKFPDLKILCAHLSGSLPFLQGRLDTAWKVFPDSKGNLSEPPTDKIRKIIYMDTISYSEGALKLASDLFGINRLLFGSDFPFEWGIENAMHSVERSFKQHQLPLVYNENFQHLIE